MKVILLLHSILLFCMHSSPSFSSAAEAPEPVLDYAGKKVRAGQNYYILPALPGTSGGLILTPGNQTYCPLDVIKADYGPGDWFQFSPANSKKGVIRVSTDLNVVYPDYYPLCPQSDYVWTLDRYDPTAGTNYVIAGGVKGNPGPKTIGNWFKIEKSEQGYKFVYCPTVCSYCQVKCQHVGIFVQNWEKRLGLGMGPYEVVFQAV